MRHARRTSTATVRGLTSVDPAALELMRSTAASTSTTLRKVRIPNALPFIFTALKVAATLATIGAIVGEYFGAPRASLGQYIAQHAAYFDFERSAAVSARCLPVVYRASPKTRSATACVASSCMAGSAWL